jgi:RNA polymerase sigma-70 factor (ECF subfamily)
VAAAQASDDQVLVAQAAGGDRDAFGVLYDRYVQDVFRFVLRRCGDASQAEDLVSVVFLEAWRGRVRLVAVEGSARPWLLGVGVNVLRNAGRSRRRHAAALARYAADPLADAPTDDPADAVASRVDAHSAAHRVTSGLARLSRREREVAELCLLEGISVAAAAQLLAIPEGTVKSRLASARRQLQRLLQTSDIPTQSPASDINKVSGTSLLRPETSAR